ncbi:hypothetical protein X564_11060 [Pseudoalteromonas agarivorans]|nr:hypothetical protein X564_11060 [Pseudoalteromonas agarivorans]
MFLFLNLKNNVFKSAVKGIKGTFSVNFHFILLRVKFVAVCLKRNIQAVI